MLMGVKRGRTIIPIQVTVNATVRVRQSFDHDLWESIVQMSGRRVYTRNRNQKKINEKMIKDMSWRIKPPRNICILVLLLSVNGKELESTYVVA